MSLIFDYFLLFFFLNSSLYNHFNIKNCHLTWGRSLSISNVDKCVGINNNSSSSRINDNDDLLLDIVDEAINVVKKSTKKSPTKEKKTKWQFLLKRNGKLSGLKDTKERSSVTVEENKKWKRLQLNARM